MCRSRVVGGVAVLVLTLTGLAPIVVAPVQAAGTSSWGHTDFDGDGDDELVIATPSESLGTIQDAGAVTVLNGSPTGVTTAGAQLWTQGTAGIPGQAQTGDRFGESWTAGDFDDDGYDDLAIGIPGDNLGTTLDAGRVQVLFGSGRGLSATGQQLLAEVTVDVPEANDRFGTALAAGDYDADGDSDLAIGAPGENVGGDAGAGAVFVFRATALGFVTAPTLWSQDTAGIAGAAEAGDGFGSALVGGRVGYDRRNDLVVGAPREDLGGAADAGAVQVLYGKSAGFNTTNDQLFTLTDIGSSGHLLIGPDALSADAGDRFGTSLAISQQGGTHSPIVIASAPFDDDPHGDVAVDVGSIAVLIGQVGGGLEVVGGNAPDEQDDPEDFGPGRQFGRVVSSRAEGVWLVALPGMPGNVVARAGQVRQYSWAVDAEGGEEEGVSYHRQSQVGETDETGDEFGGGLWSADTNGDGHPELVIGWRESLEDEGVEQAGAVSVWDTTPADEDIAVFTQSTPGVPETNQDFDRFGVQGVP